jgi:hypothetical protein
MVDRISGESRPVPIKNVAQEPGFYEPEIEVKLNEAIEKPANPVIEKLLEGQVLTSTERSSLALYISVMLKRVPSGRERVFSLVPQVLDSTIDEVRGCLVSLLGNPEYDQMLVRQRIAEVAQIYEQYQREPPIEVVKHIREPWPTARVVELIKNMTWRVLRTSGPNFYMTSDNPAFFFGPYGLEHAEAEVCFPLSSAQLLHACWKPTAIGAGFLDASQPFVREMNRRLASTAWRFAFYHEDAGWLPKLLSKTSLHLNRVVW